ncbi:hypothetical protein MRX96_012513 [Rhipicephalus microplus]
MAASETSCMDKTLNASVSAPAKQDSEYGCPGGVLTRKGQVISRSVNGEGAASGNGPFPFHERIRWERRSVCVDIEAGARTDTVRPSRKPISRRHRLCTVLLSVDVLLPLGRR